MSFNKELPKNFNEKIVEYYKGNPNHNPYKYLKNIKPNIKHLTAKEIASSKGMTLGEYLLACDRAIKELQELERKGWTIND